MGCLRALLFFAGIGFVLVMLAKLGGPPSPTAPTVAKTPPCEDASLAAVVANRLVKQRLKSPKTAEFAAPWEASHTYKGNCVHAILSYVDSQNGFGAMIRTRFLATVDMSAYDTNGGRLVSLDTF